jgi:hypothetical protein
VGNVQSLDGAAPLGRNPAIAILKSTQATPTLHVQVSALLAYNLPLLPYLLVYLETGSDKSHKTGKLILWVQYPRLRLYFSKKLI